ncbi:MAG: alginate lyase family protein [Candidatus Sulfotelmatobacter sp.]
MSKFETMLQIGRTFGVRDGVLRLEYELQRGSGLMSWRMRSVQGWDSWDLKRIAPGVRAEEMRSARRDGTRPFFFTDAQSLGLSIREIVGSGGEASIVAEAESILAGNLPFFGQLSFPCEFPPQWFRNPATGQSVSPQQPWTQMRFASPAYGDLKFILEPSRFLFIYPLVRAYALSGDERFPQAFWNAIEDWARQSPPMAGPLWICGQESSLRILAWSFALHAFINSPSTTDKRVALLVSMIAAHAWRTAQTLGYSRSQRSNHLISEAVGLWTAGTLYPELREAQIWQNLGAHLLQEAVLDQITPEGVSQQHSFNYQRMILHLLFWTLRLAEIQQVPLPEEIRSRTQAAFEFMRAWVDPESGFAPNYGSDDGSMIFPLARSAYRDFRPLLQLGAAVLDRPALPPGPWDEAALWFGTKFGAKPAVAEKAAPISSAAAETGYFRLGDSHSWALIRAGRYKRRPFQADQLHVDLWWHGINLARDAGTYLYNGSPPWNNGLARTAVHNTVTVDRHDQMRRAGRFLWVDWAQASGRSYRSPGQAYADRFEGEHDGYKRFSVKHRRAVQWLAGSGWVIIDDIEGTGVHNVRLHWLAADLPHEISDEPFQIEFAAGKSRIGWNIFAGVPGSASVIRAGNQISTQVGKNWAVEKADTQLLGWESPTYGDLQPAVSLLYETRSQLPVRFVTAVLTDERCKVKSVDGEIIILRDETELYRVNLTEKRTHSVSAHRSAMSINEA